MCSKDFEGMCRRRNENGTKRLAFISFKRPFSHAEEKDYYPLEVPGFTSWKVSRYTLIEEIDGRRCRYKGKRQA